MADQNLPSPPFINVSGLLNFRDAGGYAIESQPGKIVRRGVLYRSTEPSKVTPEGISKLQELGITDVYDLRSQQEIERDGRQGYGRQVKEWDGATRHFTPVFLVEDYSPEAIALRFKNYAHESSEGFVQAYQAILKAATSPTNPTQPYATILAHLASSDKAPPSPILVHCTAGKDRTGVVVAMLLSMLGVSDDVVAHEYALTDLGLAGRKPEILEQLMQEPSLRDNPEGASRMISSRKENMLATLAWIRSEFGSVEEAVVKLNMLTPEGIDQVRMNLIVDAQDGEQVDVQRHAKLLL